MIAVGSPNAPHRLRKRDTQHTPLAFEKAFRDSAFTRYLFLNRDPADRGVVATFEFIIRYATMYGDAYASTSAIGGVTCWYREDGLNASLWRAVQAGGFPLQSAIATRGRDWSE